MEKTCQVKLCSVQDIPVGQGACFVIQGAEVAVFRLRDGRVLAVENRCPHRQGPLSEGVAGNGKVVCPLHGHKFDLATGEGSEPSERVRVFKTWEENGGIFIRMQGKESSS